MIKENYTVLCKIMSAVETGGQKYGAGRFNDVTKPYTNSEKEHSITIGAFGFYDEAQEIVQLIFNADPQAFRQIDNLGHIENALKKNWINTRYNPNTTDRNTISIIISTPLGIEKQYEVFSRQIDKYLNDAYEYGIAKDNIPMLMAWCETQHLGGKKPTIRVMDRCNGVHTLDAFYEALKKDQKVTGANSVSAPKYFDRHEKCIEFINKYAISESGDKPMAKTTIVDEFLKYQGIKEYEGIVATIQNWYYGEILHLPWCATSTSYFANIAGILPQIGGKNEGVSEMMTATEKLHANDGRFFKRTDKVNNIPKMLPKHTIVFMKRNGSSHVAHCWRDETYTGSGDISLLGGNQSDMICKKLYNQDNISAVYFPDYGNVEPSKTDDIFIKVKMVALGSKGPHVWTAATLLKGRGFLDKVSDTCDEKMVEAINKYQVAIYKNSKGKNKLGNDDGTGDGCFGKKCWNDITGGIVI